MLKIDTPSSNATELRVALSGRMTREHLPELERLVKTAAASNRRIAFDLAQVSLVDRASVEFFASGPGRVAHLLSCPPYLREWLRGVGRRSM